MHMQREQVIYLTFDDGPHPVITPRILDILRSGNIKATFFVVGSRLETRTLAEIVVAAAFEGHAIGNHTFTHPDLTVCSDQEIRDEIESTSARLRSLGIDCRLLRPPYGRTNRRVVDVVQQLGYELVLWDNDPRDWRTDCARNQWVTNAILDVDRRNTRVLVCHDTHQQTADHLSTLIEELSVRGFDFSSLEATRLDADSREP